MTIKSLYSWVKCRKSVLKKPYKKCIWSLFLSVFCFVLKKQTHLSIQEEKDHLPQIPECLCQPFSNHFPQTKSIEQVGIQAQWTPQMVERQWYSGTGCRESQKRGSESGSRCRESWASYREPQTRDNHWPIVKVTDWFRVKHMQTAMNQIQSHGPNAENHGLLGKSHRVIAERHKPDTEIMDQIDANCHRLNAERCRSLGRILEWNQSLHLLAVFKVSS